MDEEQAMRVLGLKTRPTALHLKKAYREQVRLWHPDRYSQGSALRHLAEKNIQDANLAYTYLRQRLGEAPHRSSSLRTSRKAPSTSKRPEPKPPRDGIDVRFLKRLKRFLLKFDVSPLWKWLRPDGRKPFRPWYRYPKSCSPRKTSSDGTPRFEQALRNAMRPSSGLRRLPGHVSRLESEDAPGAIAPIGRVRRTARSDRPRG